MTFDCFTSLAKCQFSYKTIVSLPVLVLIAMRYLPSLSLVVVLLILVGEGFGAFICSGGADCTQTGRNAQPFECTDGANCNKRTGQELEDPPSIGDISRKKRSPSWRPDPKRCKNMKGQKLERCLRKSLGRKKRSPRRGKPGRCFWLKGSAKAKCRCTRNDGTLRLYCRP